MPAADPLLDMLAVLGRAAEMCITSSTAPALSFFRVGFHWHAADEGSSIKRAMRQPDSKEEAYRLRVFPGQVND